MTITLHLTPDVQRKLEALAKQTEQNVEILADSIFRQAVETVDKNGIKAGSVVRPNEKALAALRKIARMQEGIRDTDGSQTDRIIREGRAGGMYDDFTK